MSSPINRQGSLAPPLLKVRLVESIRRHEFIYLLCIMALLGWYAFFKACITPLWFDEFFTLFIARLATPAEMLKAIPADSQPPLQYLLTHLTMQLPMQAELALRLPELFAYLLTGFLAFHIVRRHGTAVQGIFATACVLGAWAVQTQAITARPYCMLLCFTALAFYCWQLASEPGRRIVPLCGLACSISAAILSHHFGVVHSGVFLAAGEFHRLLQRRRPDWPVLGAIAVGVLPLAYTVPLARQSRLALGTAVLASKNFWARPSLTDLGGYWTMVPLLLFPLLLPALLLVLAERRIEHSPEPVPPVPAHVWIAAGALCLLVPVQIILAFIGTRYYLDKYSISTALGLALLGAWALPRLPGLRRIAEPVLATALALFGLAIVAGVAMQANNSSGITVAERAESPLLLHAPPDLPIVVGSAYDYLPEWWYAQPSTKRRLLYLADPAYAVTQQDFLPELSLDTDRVYVPAPVANYSHFLESHSRFLVLASGPSRLDWLPARLSSEGWRMTTVAVSGPDTLYAADREH
jgi:4-amino-4-deoxy-L-arabinose transferase-like glycosyltransferase